MKANHEIALEREVEWLKTQVADTAPLGYQHIVAGNDAIKALARELAEKDGELTANESALLQHCESNGWLYREPHTGQCVFLT